MSSPFSIYVIQVRESVETIFFHSHPPLFPKVLARANLPMPSTLKDIISVTTDQIVHKVASRDADGATIARTRIPLATCQTASK